MPPLRVALLQLLPSGVDQDANLIKGEAFCRAAAAMGADIALFPEMWNIGYSTYLPDTWHDDCDPIDPQFDALRAEWQARAVPTDGPYVQHFQALARTLNMAIAITYLEQWPGAPRNSVSLIDRRGEIALTYAKVHTCEWDMEAACTPGEVFPVAALDTAHGPVAVGCMICFDREHPESARTLMLHGAEIILTPNACTLELNRLTQYRTRAYENMTGMAMTNYPAPQNNGHSIAFDGISHDLGGSRDMLLVEAGEQEGVFVADFDLDRLRAYRASEIWGNAYRKPRAYHALTEVQAAPPFVRPYSRR